jgi:HEAT repeat protein
MRKKIVVIGLAASFALLIAGVAWFQRMPLLTWFYVRGLAKAAEKDREIWVNRVAALEGAAVPRLLDCLRRTDSKACANVLAGLTEIIGRWRADDARRADLATHLAEAFSGLSPAGQSATLKLQTLLFRTSQREAVLSATVQVLAEAARQKDQQVHGDALLLASELWQETKADEAVPACRVLVRTCLHDEVARIRLEAIHLASVPGIDLLEPVAALLEDSVREVRRAALLAVGSSPAAVSTDDLLSALHDDDEVVRRLCEEALRGRGLQEEHIKLGRLMTDREPGTRLQVLDLLRQANDLEPGAWLRRLSHDDSPAVRAAAVRAVCEQRTANLSDRLEQMAQNDPSPTVRQLAQHYLSCQKVDKSNNP